MEATTPWIIPVIMFGLLTYGFIRKVPVYEAFVGGARDGFQVAVRIIPYLVGILVAVGMFRHSGALGALIWFIEPVTSLVGLPGEALPMALLRPLSGSGAYGVLVSIISDPTIGPDTYTGYLVSTFQGSTETTFYVLAVYFGAVGIKRIRHAMAAALTADLAGVIGAVIICWMLYGGR
jgi:spore maturation protein SpmB